jgi:alanyl-tRNA synthetase
MGYAQDREDGGEGANRAFSVELCGGTHVARTGDIGLITIVSEGAVAAGVRRIEAKTAVEARHYLNAEASRLRHVATLLKSSEDDAPKRLAQLIEERRKLERELSATRRELALGAVASAQPLAASRSSISATARAGAGSVAASQPSLGASAEAVARFPETSAPGVEDIGGVKFLSRAVTNIATKDLKSLADEAKQRVGSGVVAIASVDDAGKAGIVVGVTDDLTDRFDSVALVRLAAAKLGGKGGGGRRDMAQAGGPDGAGVDAALTAIGDALRSALSAA